MSPPYLRFLLTLIVALSLTILPLPQPLSSFRPPWVLLLVLYFEFFLLPCFNILVLLILGLMLDVLLASVMGEHAFALILVTWIASQRVRRFNYFSTGQQMIFIGFLCLIYQSLIIIIEVLQGHPISFISIGGVMISSILWPWIKLLGNDTLQLKKNW